MRCRSGSGRCGLLHRHVRRLQIARRHRPRQHPRRRLRERSLAAQRLLILRDDLVQRLGGGGGSAASAASLTRRGHRAHRLQPPVRRRVARPPAGGAPCAGCSAPPPGAPGRCHPVRPARRDHPRASGPPRPPRPARHAAASSGVISTARAGEPRRPHLAVVAGHAADRLAAFELLGVDGRHHLHHVAGALLRLLVVLVERAARSGDVTEVAADAERGGDVSIASRSCSAGTSFRTWMFL